MFGRRLTLFRLSGFEVRLDASWIILAVLITWSLATGYFPGQSPGLAPQTYWVMGAASALGLFGSIVVHEFAHSVVARRRGIPMRGITLFIFGGVAEMGGEPPSAATEFQMAIAGPLASLVIGCVAYGIYWTTQDTWPVEISGVFRYLGWINWSLAAFNMIPAFPLDGGRVLRSALWRSSGNLSRATEIASRVGAGFGALLMALAVVQLILGNVINAMWWFLIGTFLRGAAQSSHPRMEPAGGNLPISLHHSGSAPR